MMGRWQREKGKRFEREIADRLRSVLPADAEQIRRGWQSRSGRDDADVILPEWLGLWIECKVGARPNIVAAIEQAREACGPTMAPVAITRRDRETAIVSMGLDDWLGMLVHYARARRILTEGVEDAETEAETRPRNAYED
jgi:hypothetical protein